MHRPIKWNFQCWISLREIHFSGFLSFLYKLSWQTPCLLWLMMIYFFLHFFLWWTLQAGLDLRSQHSSEELTEKIFLYRCTISLKNAMVPSPAIKQELGPCFIQILFIVLFLLVLYKGVSSIWNHTNDFETIHNFLLIWTMIFVVLKVSDSFLLWGKTLLIIPSFHSHITLTHLPKQ